MTITANTRVKTVNVTYGGRYSALPSTNAAAHSTANGSGATFVLNFGIRDAEVTDGGSGYTLTPTVTVGGTGGTGAVASANIQPTGGAAAAVAHQGWVLVTEGSGGRAGRITTEVLVTSHIVSDNANDDPIFNQ